MSTLLANENSIYTRGFTDHEHLNRTGFVHMNGRVYDPRIGRFVSPDPIVSNPYSSQSYNRYSYVSNSPMSFTDPSGFCERKTAHSCGIASMFNGLDGGFGSQSKRNPRHKGSATAGLADGSLPGILDGIRHAATADGIALNATLGQGSQGGGWRINGQNWSVDDAVGEAILTASRTWTSDVFANGAGSNAGLTWSLIGSFVRGIGVMGAIGQENGKWFLQVGVGYGLESGVALSQGGQFPRPVGVSQPDSLEFFIGGGFEWGLQVGPLGIGQSTLTGQYWSPAGNGLYINQGLKWNDPSISRFGLGIGAAAFGPYGGVSW